MSCCSVRWCGKNSRTSNYKTDGTTFHRFPKEPDLKEKWIDSTKRDNWFPTEFSVICSRHFTEDCFDTTKYHRRRLFKTAIPTLHLPLVSNASVPTERAPQNTSPIPSFSSQLEPMSATAMTPKRKATDHETPPQFHSPNRKRLCERILDTTITSECASVNPSLMVSSLLQAEPISTMANKRKLTDPETQCHSLGKKFICLDTTLTSERASVNSGLICEPISTTPRANKRKATDPETPSRFHSPTKKRLCRRILDLKKQVTNKNKTIKVLRDKLRYYKKRVESLKVIIKCIIRAKDE